MSGYRRDSQYVKFSAYGFLKNLKLFEPFLVLFLLEKGLSFTMIGALYAYREIMVNLLEVPTGLIADACGRRRSMVQSFAAYIAAFLLFYFSANFGLLLLGMTAFACGEAFRGGTHKAMIFEYLQLQGWSRHKIDYYGHTRAWSQRGSAVAALLAAAIVCMSGRYDLVFLASTLPYFLNLCLMLSYPAELDGQIRHGASLKQSFASVRQSLRTSLQASGNLRATTNVCIYDGFYNAAKDFVQPMIKALALSLPIMLNLGDKQRSAVLVGLVYFIIYLLTSRAAAAAGRFAARFDNLPQPLNLSMLGGFGLGGFCGLAHFYGFNLAAIIGFMGIFVIQNLRSPLSVSYVSETVPSQILATSLSVRAFVTALYTAGMALVLGILADWLGLGAALTVLSLGLITLTPLYRLKTGPRS